MSRSICIVLVALVIIQVAFANVAVDRGIITLELTNLTAPETELFNGELKNSKILGDMTVGQRMAGETNYTFKIRHENYDRLVKDSLYIIPLDADKKAHYVNAVNTNGITAVICGTQATVGYSYTALHIRQPPNTESLITINVSAH